MLDQIEPQWLHITTQAVGPIGELRGEEEAIRDAIARELADIDPPVVTFDRPAVWTEAVVFTARPAAVLDEVRRRIHGAVVNVIGSQRAYPLKQRFDPHVSSAYVKADGPKAPICARLEGLQAESVEARFAKVDWLEFRRDRPMYVWRSATPIPIGRRANWQSS